MPRSRLAVVLLVPDPPASEIDALRRALGDTMLERVAPHVTLVPPVNVNDAHLDEVTAGVELGARAASPIALRLGPTATFWPATPVVYLAVGGDVDAVERIRTKVMVGPLDRPPDWPFVPHVTLADHMEPDRIASTVAALDRYGADVTVDRVHVLREDEDRRWRVMAEASLDGPRIIGRGGLELELVDGELLDPGAADLFDRWWHAHVTASYGAATPAARPFGVTARREGRPVGVATGTTDDELHLDRLVVDGGVRGQGVGGRLLAEVELLGRRRGCRRAVLVCRSSGPLPAWYGDRGWVVDLELPDWRHGRPFVRMVRALS